jgi:hypothetical protein
MGKLNYSCDFRVSPVLCGNALSATLRVAVTGAEFWKTSVPRTECGNQLLMY